MIRKLFRMALRRFERQNSYDVSYSRFVLDHSLPAFWKFAKLNGFAQHNEDVPRDAYFAAKLTSARIADCGPCTQLVSTWAERAKVPDQIIRAVLTRDFNKMPADIELVARFAEAVLARDLEADEFRERIRSKWGDRAVISLAFAITAGQIFPTVKYALGFGHACTLVRVGNELVRVSHNVPKILQAI
jgi:hypothetical protein